jgi:hypothetical protein
MAAHSCSPTAARAPPSARAPHQARVLPSITTANLHDELIRHCRGEDSRITIECHHERRRNIEDHNLERDFQSLAPIGEAPAARAMCPLALQQALGVHGAHTTSSNGGLTTQVLAPPIGEL